MFYCNKCGEKRDWPTDAFMKSMGVCEICGKSTVCNAILSKYLPVPKVILGKGIQDIQLGGEHDEEISSVGSK